MTRTPYVDRTAEVVALAPVAPPCFPDRLTWLEYLKAAASAHRDRHEPGPLLIVRGQPVRFNRALPFCADCTAQHAHAMTVAGRCDKDYLLNLIPKDRTGPAVVCAPKDPHGLAPQQCEAPKTAESVR